MRKHNEGYSLVLVLVVLVVICLVAAFILSFSLNNLKNQQESVKLMKEKYEAMGEIEKYVTKLEQKIKESQPEENVTDEIDYTINLTADDFWELKQDLNVEVTNLEESIRLVGRSSGSTEIYCEIFFVAQKVTQQSDGYKLIDCTGIGYKSYEISKEVAPK